MSGRGSSRMPKANGLKKIPGGPAPQASVGWGSKAKEQKEIQNVYFDPVADNDAGRAQALTNYPYLPFAPNDYDTVANIKYEFGQAEDVGRNWVVPLTERDIEWLLQKRDQLEKADFDSWSGQKFDLTDPAQVALFKQICPEYFERRKEVIETQIEIQRRVALLKLLGITSMDDMRLAWAIETGRINPYDGSVANPLAWRNANNATNETKFKAGYYSVISWLVSTDGGKERNAANPFAAVNTAAGAATYNPAIYAKTGRVGVRGRNYEEAYPNAPRVLYEPPEEPEPVAMADG